MLTGLFPWLQASGCSKQRVLLLVAALKHQVICHLQKQVSVDGRLEDERRPVEIALTEGFGDWGGGGGVIMLAEDLQDCG